MAERRNNLVESPAQRRDRDGRDKSAIGTLQAAGLTVEPIDDQKSLVAGRFEWHRTTHHFQERNGTRQGYGLTKLIAAARENPAQS